MTFDWFRNLHRIKRTFSIIFILFNIYHLPAQDHKLYLGFGGGINFSIPQEQRQIFLYEYLSKEPHKETYSEWFRNMGYQYFFYVDFRIKNLVISGYPGTNIHKLSKNTLILNGNDPVDQESLQILNYFKIPVEVKYILFGDIIKPYLGAGGAYAMLTKHSGRDNSLISSKFTAGPVTGVYLDLRTVTINLNAGYNMALHNITRKSDRYVNNGTGLFAQSDMKLSDIFLNISLLLSLEKTWRISSLQCNYP